MKNKQKLKDILRQIKLKALERGDDEIRQLCQEAEDTVETEDESGSNPPGQPPGNKPPGGG